MTINLDNMDEELKKKVINLQNLQRTLEFITNQKIQIESSLKETELAVEFLEKTADDTTVYKSIGGILVMSEKNRLLDEKKSLKVSLEMRSKTLKTKEDRAKSQLEALKKSIQADLQNK